MIIGLISVYQEGSKFGELPPGRKLVGAKMSCKIHAIPSSGYQDPLYGDIRSNTTLKYIWDNWNSEYYVLI